MWIIRQLWQRDCWFWHALVVFWQTDDGVCIQKCNQKLLGLYLLHCTVMFIYKLQAIAYLSIPSYIAWSLLDTCFLLWLLVRVLLKFPDPPAAETYIYTNLMSRVNTSDKSCVYSYMLETCNYWGKRYKLVQWQLSSLTWQLAHLSFLPATKTKLALPIFPACQILLPVTSFGSSEAWYQGSSNRPRIWVSGQIVNVHEPLVTKTCHRCFWW